MDYNPNFVDDNLINQPPDAMQIFNQKGGTPISSLSTYNNTHHNTNYNNPHQNKIPQLVSKVNQMLDDYEPPVRKQKSKNKKNKKVKFAKIQDEEEDEFNFDDEDDIIYDKKGKVYLPRFLKEPLLLLFIFIILSQFFVKRMIGNFLPFTNIDEMDGLIKQNMGIMVNGLILVVLFYLLKRFI
jgi:hypothetical protein